MVLNLYVCLGRQQPVARSARETTKRQKDAGCGENWEQPDGGNGDGS